MALDITPSISPSDLKAQDADNEAKIWKAGADMFEQTEDVLTGMEGAPGSDAIIETETDTSAGKGHEITYRVRSGFYGQGRMNEERFEQEYMEELKMSSNKLRVGYIRNATRFWFLTEDELGMANEIDSGHNEELGKWMGREKTFQGLACAIHQTETENYYDVGQLTVSAIQDGSAILEPMGGRPAFAARDRDNNPIYGLCYLTTAEGGRVLKEDPRYDELLENSGVRGPRNSRFSGGFEHLDGNVVKKWVVKDHDGEGPVGSPLNPKAYLGQAIAAGDATFDIRGGGDTDAATKEELLFFRDFPRYAWRFVGGVAVLSATHWSHQLEAGDKFYVAIVNPKNAATDAKKYGMYRVSVNDGHKLTVDQRLGSAASGIRVTQVGEVAYDSDKHTEVHGVGSLIIPVTADGKPWGRTIAFGARAMRRGYGRFRNRRRTQTHEGGDIQELYCGSIFGQAPRRDRRGRVPGLIVMRHQLDYKGWDHEPL